ncbi:SH3 domain, partial [Trinorchestia longiramus]
MEVEVLYVYEPKEEDELRLRVGDVITKVVKQEAGWFKGTSLSGDTGVFPDNFVK